MIISTRCSIALKQATERKRQYNFALLELREVKYLWIKTNIFSLCIETSIRITL